MGVDVRTKLIASVIVLGLAASMPQMALADTSSVPAISVGLSGAVTVTLTNGKSVVVSADLAAKILAAMQSGDADAVQAAIQQLVSQFAATDSNLATAILVVAKSDTADATLQTAAQNGVLAANPG